MAPNDNNFLLELANDAKIADKEFLKFLSTANTSGDLMMQYQKYLQSASATSSKFGATLKSVAANIGIMLAINAGISLIAKGLDVLIDTADECKERVDNLMSTYNSAITTANNNAKSAEDLSGRYKELSKGVNNLGENLSLTIEEYKEYNSIVNQIADMFPTLITGYTDEGNAILSLKGNVEDLKGAYKDAQQEAYNLLIVSGKDSSGNDIIKEYKNLSRLPFWDRSLLTNDVTTVSKRDMTKQILDLMQDMDTATDKYDEFAKSVFDTYDSRAFDFLKEMGLPAITNSFSRNSGTGVTKEALKTARATVQAYYQGFQAEIDSSLQKTRTLANAFLMTNQDYDDLDEQSKNAVSIIVNSLDENIANEFDTLEDVGTYVATVLNTIKDNPEFQSTLIDLFTLDTTTLTPDKAKELIDSYIDILSQYLGEDSNVLKIRLGFEDVDQLDKNFNNAISTAAQKFSTDSIEPETLLKKSHKFFNENSINTPEEIDAWNKIASTASSAAVAMAEYTRQKAKEIPLKTYFSYTDILEELDEMSGAFNTIDATYANFIDKDKEITFENLSALSEQFKDVSDIDSYIKAIHDAKGDTEATQQAFDRLTTAYIKQTGILDHLNESNASLIQSYLQEQGITNAEVIVTDQLALQHERLTAEKYYNANASDLLQDATIGEINQFVNSANAADVSKQVLAELALQKISVNDVSIDTASDIDQVIGLANAAGASATVLAKLANAKAILAKAEQNALNGSIADLKQLEHAQALLEEIENGTFDYEFKLDPEKFKKTIPTDKTNLNKTSSSTDPKTNAPTPKDYDWIQRALDSVQRKREALQKQVDAETNSYHDQISALQELIELDEQFESVNKTALDTYTSRWEEIRHQLLEVFGEVEGNKLISKIMVGDLTKEGSKDTYAGKQAETLDEALSIYDNLTEAEEKYSNSVEEKNNHIAEQYKKRIAEIDEYISQLSNKLSQAQSNLDLKDITGRQITEADYKELIGIVDDQIDQYYDKLDELNAQIASLDDEGSPEYYSLRSAIASCEQAISDAEKSQAEWNEEIKNIPIRKIERYLELLGQIKQDLTNYIDERNALGIHAGKDQYLQLIEITRQQMEELLKQQDLLKDKLGTYQFNSDKYNETASSLQDIDDEISDLIQSQYEWNKAILQIPVDSITKTNETLQNTLSAMSDILSDYDSAISAVTSALDKQINAINDLKDTATEEYESKIKPFQDELDLLQKQNDARQMQLELEQAAYDLAHAQQQKTNKVIRDGEVTYEADQDAIRSAENAKKDADHNKAVRDLETQISNLEEERDKLLEGYDDQIEKLDEIKDRWSSIAEDIKSAADSLKADELLGAGWQDKILSGNDADMLNSIKNLYTTISDQKNQYEEQIASNERITDMMNQFMESWQNGSITYDQAMAGIKDLANQMKDGYSSLEHLDALMDLNGVTDLGTLLSQMQDSANASVDQFEDYMKIVKENADALEKYNLSWEEMQQNIRDQIAALEKLAKEAEKAAANMERHSSSSSGGGSKGPDTNDKSYVNDGPGRTDEGYNNAVANGQEIREYHKGGIVGGESTSGALKSNEVLAKLEIGEQVITEKQRQYYNAVLQSLLDGEYSPAMTMPIYQAPATGKTTPIINHPDSPIEVNINMGDVNLPQVKDGEGFAEYIVKRLDLDVAQEIGKIRKHH